jgi:PAS domain S-box-containing protein
VSIRTRRSEGARSLRKLAEASMATGAPVDLKSMTSGEIRELVHELEVHKVELQIQNAQLRETQLSAEESREQYRRLYDSAPIGYLTLDSGGMILQANLAASGLLRIPSSRLISQNLSKFVARWHQDRWHLARRALAKGKDSTTLELDLALSDGGVVHAQLTGASGTEQAPRERGEIRLALLDVTGLRTTERALRKAAAMVSVVEKKERQKLASDLHDDVGQLLSLASLKLRALSDALGGEPDLRIRELAEILAATRQRVSSLSFQLSPPLLQDVGLVAAASWLAEDLERSYGLVVRVMDQEELELDEATRITLFRAMRELLLNVAKHAGVREARVRIWIEGEMARIAVEDGGIGFNPEAPQHGFGLLALRERFGQLGGSLSIASIAGGGATVVASLPLKSDTADVEGDSG